MEGKGILLILAVLILILTAGTMVVSAGKPVAPVYKTGNVGSGVHVNLPAGYTAVGTSATCSISTSIRQFTVPDTPVAGFHVVTYTTWVPAENSWEIHCEVHNGANIDECSAAYVLMCQQ